MPAVRKERQGLRVFCPVHRVSFECAGGGRVVCEAGAHVLAERFPHTEIWEYCCDCESCWPSAAGQQGRGPAEKCPVCGRAAARRFLCGACRLFSLESDEGGERKVYRVVSGAGVRPACPGCGTTPAGATRRHECQAARALFMTTRAECPFCAELISELPPFPSTVDAYLAKADALPITKFTAHVADGGKGLLTPSESGEFILIQAARDLHEMIALPRRRNFGRAEEFAAGPYASFFACDEPAPGEVLVVAPARVVRVKDGWMLTSVGRLGVRAAESPRRGSAAAEKEGVKGGATPAGVAREVPAGQPRNQLLSARTAGLVVLLTALLLGSFVAYRVLSPLGGTSPQPGVSVTALAQEKRSLHEKLSELDELLKRLREMRAMAIKDRGGPAAREYEELLNRAPDLSQQALDSLKELDEREAALRNEAALLLAAERSSRPVSDEAPVFKPEWLIALLAVSGLGLLGLGSQFFWPRSQFRREHADSVSTSEFEVRRVVESATLQYKSLGKRLDTFQQVMLETGKQLASVRDELGQLKRGVSAEYSRVAETRPRVSAAREYVGPALVADKAASPPVRVVDWTKEEQAKPHVFPVPAGEYMSMVKDSSHRMRPDYFNDLLVEDPENRGKLLLVNDPPGVKDGTSYVVPSINYFMSKQDYINNYSHYFDCSEQSVGYVWINKPARVRKVADGWKLIDKGLLEVRQ